MQTHKADQATPVEMSRPFTACLKMYLSNSIQIHPGAAPTKAGSFLKWVWTPHSMPTYPHPYAGYPWLPLVAACDRWLPLLPSWL